MKHILKTLFYIILVFAFNSCETERTKATPESNGFTATNVITPTTLVLVPANDSNVFNKISWTKVDNGVNSISTYKIQIADHLKDPNFLNPAEYVGSGLSANSHSRTCQLTNLEINKLINLLPSFTCNQMNIDIRIKSMLGTSDANSFNQYSNKLNFLVTGYPTIKPILAFVLNTSNPANGSKLKASAYTTTNDFEGYTFLQAGNYKFYQPDACGSFTTSTVLGQGGTSGTLVANGTDIVIPTTGHYLIKVNLASATKTYSIKYFKGFSLFGTAKGFPGAAAVPMTDANNNNEWKLTIDLLKGKLYKFKAQDWTAALLGTPPAIPSGAAGTTIISILGTSSDPNGLEEVTVGADITVPGTSGSGSQKYNITIDVSNPRDYTYKAEINNN